MPPKRRTSQSKRRNSGGKKKAPAKRKAPAKKAGGRKKVVVETVPLMTMQAQPQSVIGQTYAPAPRLATPYSTTPYPSPNTLKSLGQTKFGGITGYGMGQSNFSGVTNGVMRKTKDGLYLDQSDFSGVTGGLRTGPVTLQASSEAKPAPGIIGSVLQAVGIGSTPPPPPVSAELRTIQSLSPQRSEIVQGMALGGSLLNQQPIPQVGQENRFVLSQKYSGTESAPLTKKQILEQRRSQAVQEEIPAPMSAQMQSFQAQALSPQRAQVVQGTIIPNQETTKTHILDSGEKVRETILASQSQNPVALAPTVVQKVDDEIQGQSGEIQKMLDDSNLFVANLAKDTIGKVDSATLSVFGQKLADTYVPIDGDLDTADVFKQHVQDVLKFAKSIWNGKNFISEGYNLLKYPYVSFSYNYPPTAQGVKQGIRGSIYKAPSGFFGFGGDDLYLDTVTGTYHSPGFKDETYELKL